MNHSRVSRGGRAGFEGGRGRGRGTDRGRGGRGRGASVAHTNGSRSKENTDASVPTTESTAWDTAATNEAPSLDTTTKPSGEESWASTATTTASTTAAATTKATSSIIPDGVKKSWASMFAPVPTPKKAPEPAEKYI